MKFKSIHIVESNDDLKKLHQGSEEKFRALESGIAYIKQELNEIQKELKENQETLATKQYLENLLANSGCFWVDISDLRANHLSGKLFAS